MRSRLFTLVLLTAIVVPLAGLTQTMHPDLEVGANPLGSVEGVTADGILVVKRTNNGSKDGRCSVRLFGVVLPKDKVFKSKAIHWLRKRLTGAEVRFHILERTKNLFTCSVTVTDLKPGSATNGYLVYLGLANTDHPEMHEFAFALKHAQSNKLGIWSRKK